MKRALPAVILGAVALITFVAFFPSLRNQFVNWDDVYNLVNNPHFRGFSLDQMKWMLSTIPKGPYQPLAWLSYALDYKIWGMNPFGYHLTSLLIHCLNAVLFCLVSRRLLEIAQSEFCGEYPAACWLASGCAALLFAIHPLRVESVSWATERRDVLCGLFYLLTFLFWLRAQMPENVARRFRWRILAYVAFTLSLLSKGMAVTLPVVLIILDIYPLRRFPADVRQWFSRPRCGVWLEKIPLVIPVIAVTLIGLGSEAHAKASLFSLGWIARFELLCFSPVFYLLKTLWPVHLLPIYEMPPHFDIGAPRMILSVAVTGLITGIFIGARRLWPAMLAVWAAYLVTLLPVSGIAQFGIQIAADRYSYLPCMGWAVLFGAGVLTGLTRKNGASQIPVAILLVAFFASLGAATWRQAGTWQNSGILWTRALSINPHSATAHLYLADVCLEGGDSDLAIAQYGDALRINFNNPVAHQHLAVALLKVGRREEAMDHIQASLVMDPRQPDLQFNFGALLAQEGRWNEAVDHYRMALALEPGRADWHYNLALALQQRGQIDEAMEQYRLILALDLRNAQAHNNLAAALSVRGRIPEALDQMREALQLDPQNSMMRHNLDVLENSTPKRQPS